MSALNAAFSDVIQGWKFGPFWRLLAWNDLKQRFRRSWLGVGWVMVAFILFLGSKLVIFSFLTKASFPVFAIHLTVGFAAWRFIMGAVVEGANTFIGAENWIKGERLPLSVHAYRAVFRNFMLALGTLLPVMAVVAYYGHSSLAAWLSFPAVVVVYLINAFWIAIVFGALCARLRDISHLTVTSMQIMFFLTPIIWRTEDIGGAAKYVKWNPFTYYLDLIRVPVQTGTWPVESWIVVGCFTGAGLLLALSYFAYARQKIIFWL